MIVIQTEVFMRCKQCGTPFFAEMHTEAKWVKASVVGSGWCAGVARAHWACECPHCKATVKEYVT